MLGMLPFPGRSASSVPANSSLGDQFRQKGLSLESSNCGRESLSERDIYVGKKINLLPVEKSSDGETRW